MLCAGFMSGVAYVSLSVTRFVAMEVVERRLAARGQRPVVAVVRVKAVVDMAVEAVMAMEPWTSTKEHAANKPVRSIVTVRRAVVWGIVEVSIGADGGRPSDVDSDPNLGGRHRTRAE